MREIVVYLSHFCFLLGRNLKTNSFLFCVSKRFYAVGSTFVQLYARKRRFLLCLYSFPLQSDFQFYRRKISKMIRRFFA